MCDSSMKQSRVRRFRAGLVFIVLAGLAVAATCAPRLGAAGEPSAVTVLPWGPTPSAAFAYARATAIAAVGRALFNDPMLSASGRVACSTCHDPAHGFSAPNAMPVQIGGPELNRPGTRAVPGLTYAQFSPAFTEHFFESEDDGDESADQGPTGGLAWDGRVDRARDQARLPLLDPAEMANTDPAAVVAAVSRSASAGAIRSLYGGDVFLDPGRAFAAITEALEFYQQTPAEFSAFDSKYDAFLRGVAVLTEQERRGLALFDDPEKGNCARCHRSAATADGRPPLFTDFGYVALGAPRNRAIPANVERGYFDLGLCGPLRNDLADQKTYCGMFKTPSLRNVALKGSLFHNGVFHSLRDVVAFYAERDTNPAKWYPVGADGTVSKFDDLPAEFVANVNVEPPFGGHVGDQPALSGEDVDDIVAFLQTLTDGYMSGRKAATGSAASSQK